MAASDRAVGIAKRAGRRSEARGRGRRLVGVSATPSVACAPSKRLRASLALILRWACLLGVLRFKVLLEDCIAGHLGLAFGAHSRQFFRSLAELRTFFRLLLRRILGLSHLLGVATHHVNPDPV
jgi:hypothetical protein